jgi:predicted nucleic acid-binding protein
LLLDEPESPALRRLAQADPALVVWWSTPVECGSAIARLTRDGVLTRDGEDAAMDLLGALGGTWSEILPSPGLRGTALRLLRVHPLRAADALQLAAALVWTGGAPNRAELVTRDARLADAARKEGFAVR